MSEKLIRFCPECGHLGDAPAGFRDCCPEGNIARMIPRPFARLLVEKRNAATAAAIERDALRKRIADAETVLASKPVTGSALNVIFENHYDGKRVALVVLEDGE